MSTILDISTEVIVAVLPHDRADRSMDLFFLFDIQTPLQKYFENLCAVWFVTNRSILLSSRLWGRDGGCNLTDSTEKSSTKSRILAQKSQEKYHHFVVVVFFFDGNIFWVKAHYKCSANIPPTFCPDILHLI